MHLLAPLLLFALPFARLGLGHQVLFQSVFCIRCPDVLCVILLVFGLGGIMYDWWLSFIPAL